MSKFGPTTTPPSHSLSIPFDNNITNVLFAQLKRTQEKCEKLSVAVENQERHFSMAEVDRVTENRKKAESAYADSEQRINKLNSMNALKSFFVHIRDEKGLFYRIFRGKINKRVISHLDCADSEKEKLKFTY